MNDRQAGEYGKRHQVPRQGRSDEAWKGLAKIWALLDEWEEEKRGRRAAARIVLWVALAGVAMLSLAVALYPSAIAAVLRFAAP